ncbi:FAD/NAD(P)-binding protein [Laspinema olomoucense]|uniref:FAD/NAD(P)-binding protein n=1 Tax=Laspinema olomoucense TaxID=3231600 RepID=UPI0021BB10CB|nr:FAD/NAD(P)-binding protein [Laspinema sp. D3a]MCT7986995.1 FAD/NAD(P)-binding protein [Laspinema sp. D3a]
MENLPLEIAIVGGGLSGALVATHLLRSASQPLTLHLIEPRPDLGRGIAYGTNYSCHLLNVPAGKMSAFSEEPDDFLRWMVREKDPTVQADSFLPRQIYGEYIQGVLEQSAAVAAERVQFKPRTDEAIAVKPHLQGATVYLKSGETIDAHKIVLALGNFPPKDPPVHDARFYQSQRYISYPWSERALTGLNSSDAVLLIGSGLTMVDLAVALKEQGHTGTIYGVSRHGQLPHSHQFTSPYPAFLAPETAPKTLRGLFRQVREEVESAIARGDDWRSVIDSLRPITQQLWQQMSPGDRQRFLRHVRPYWEVHRHRVSPGVAETVGRMLDAGQLVLLAGRVHAYEEDAEGVKVSVSTRGTGHRKVLEVKRVINCTGSECDYRKFQHPLIVNLRSQNLIRPDPLALGLDVAENGAIRNSEGVVSQLFYTLGSPRKGGLWETTAVREIRQQAVELSRELLRSPQTD